MQNLSYQNYLKSAFNYSDKIHLEGNMGNSLLISSSLG
jgi:hypothetical protein